MTIKEEIAYSSDVRRFTLFKEGLFYKCYNEDAMIFVQKVRAFKISDKFVKSAREKVYSIGFPSSEVVSVHWKNRNDTKKTIYLSGKTRLAF